MLAMTATPDLLNQPRDLFTGTGEAYAPLAERLRPKSLDDMVGQQHLLGEGKPIRVAYQSKRMPLLRVIDLGMPNERAPWPTEMK